jgi:PAS domain S-box-containing protein
MTDTILAPARRSDERERLAALRNLGILDTEPDPALDVVTRLAADRFDAPIALVSLVDADRQWFKARCGLETQETERSVSFCTHTIEGEGIMVVPNAARDPRFADNPLVTGDPHIRFYAGAPLRTTDGHAIGTLCIIDRTAREGFSEREAEALRLMASQAMAILEGSRIRQEQRISQLIAQTTTDAFVCADPDGRIILWNEGAHNLFGWSADEALGQSLHLIIPDRHRHGHDTGMERLISGAPTRLVGKTVEVPATCKDGGEMPVELSLAMWRHESDGSPAGFAAIIRDISERKAAEAERADTEARLAQKVAAIEASDDGFAITDANGIFTFMNRAHAALFGYEDPSDLIGQPWSVLYDAAEGRRIEEKVMPVVAEFGVWRGETVGRRCDGTPVEQEIALTLAADGGLVCVTRGIGERLAMEREKMRLREQLMLAQRQESVGQLASGIAHDFNNLIAAIAGTAGLMERSEDAQIAFHAQRIQAAAGTAAGLVDKMLSLGRRETEPKLIDLRIIFSSVRDLVAPSLADPLHRIALEVPDEPVLIRADATEVMQVALNLALNARDALALGKAGLVALSIGPVGSEAPRGEVVVGEIPAEAAIIRVRDTGCGIPSDDLTQVFEPYYTRKGEAGTGLGLAVVAGIVASAGGAIAVESKPGEGTLFEVCWPPELRAEKPDPLAALGPLDAQLLAGKAVLVVDDNPAVVDTVVAMLERAGAEPAPCLDPEDAIAAIEEDPQAFDLVLTDYDMPGMNGPELARALRAIRADLPLLLLTAVPLAYGRRAGEAEPFDAVLTKPANMESLVASARLAIATARRRQP